MTLLYLDVQHTCRIGNGAISKVNLAYIVVIKGKADDEVDADTLVHSVISDWLTHFFHSVDSPYLNIKKICSKHIFSHSQTISKIQNCI